MRRGRPRRLPGVAVGLVHYWGPSTVAVNGSERTWSWFFWAIFWIAPVAVRISIRPKNPREEIDILQYLHGINAEAQEQGGRVLSVLGNHDIGAFEARYRANSDGDITTQGWGGVEKKFDHWFVRGGNSGVAGFFACSFPTLLQVNGNVYFCHGGLWPDYVAQAVRAAESAGAEDFVTFVNALAHDYLLGNGQVVPEMVERITQERRISTNIDSPKFRDPVMSDKDCEEKLREIAGEINDEYEARVLGLWPHTAKRRGDGGSLRRAFLGRGLGTFGGFWRTPRQISGHVDVQHDGGTRRSHFLHSQPPCPPKTAITSLRNRGRLLRARTTREAEHQYGRRAPPGVCSEREVGFVRDFF